MLRRALARVLVITVIAVACISAAGRQSAPAQGAAPTFDAARAFTHLKAMVGFGPRPSGSAALRQTRAYITRQIGAMGLTVQEQPFTATTPVGPVEMSN